VKGWNIDGAGHLINPRVLKICESTTDNFVALRVDNRIVGGGPTDLHGNPSGGGTVHTCTNEPDTAIVAVKILHHDGTESDVSACGNVHVKATDWLQIDFVAHDPNGHLAMYSLQATYDVNLANDLLSLPSATLSASPVAVAGVPPAAQVGPDYAAARLAGAVAPTWNGGVVRLKQGDRTGRRVPVHLLLSAGVARPQADDRELRSQPVGPHQPQRVQLHDRRVIA
jgi:hypothetical protein